MMRSRTVCTAILCALLCHAALVAAPSGSVTVRGQARPSFRITPLLQRLSGRQGQRINFSFDVQTLGEPLSVRVRAVGLEQQLNGLVVADEAAPPPDAVQLSSPLQLDLKAEQTETIRGHVDVPRSQAPFHAFGILVTDLGRPLQVGSSGGREQAGVHVRFVTQYLLRVEVQVPGGRQENAKQLRIQSATLVEREGRSVAEVEVSNPTEAAVEFELSGRLVSSDGVAAVEAFELALPARASRPAPQRYESLIFAGGRVLLSAPVPDAVFPGEYRLEVEWLSGRRKCGQASFPVVVHEGDFPAQDAEFAQVARTLRLSPAQLELSLGARGNRRIPLRVANSGAQPIRVELTMHNLDGTAADWAMVTPSELLLTTGRGRNVLVTARPGTDLQHHRYGFVRVNVSGQTAGSQDLPLALLAAIDTSPGIRTGRMRWDAHGPRPAFVLPVKNLGAVHFPLNGRLIISDPAGGRVEVPGGFDRWLLPGQERELRFAFHRPLAPGVYAVRVQIPMGEGREALTVTDEVKVE